MHGDSLTAGLKAVRLKESFSNRTTTAITFDELNARAKAICGNCECHNDPVLASEDYAAAAEMDRKIASRRWSLTWIGTTELPAE